VREEKSVSHLWQTAAEVLNLIREPVPAEKRRLLAERWRDLDERWRSRTQGLGQQATGCGATIGALPACDFDCEGCYLGSDANGVERLPLPEILAQLDRMREYLGPKGNVQITDGEVTLLPEPELISILRHARSIGLIPMVMTHGETFRRRPELLPRLVRQGGLTEISIHVDSLQRGRRAGDDRESETELMDLRDEFAEIVRKARAGTGVRLRAAMSVTVSRSNLREIPSVVEWAFRNRDLFGLISFQPLAQVGRTLDTQEGVGVDELWEAIGAALSPFGFDGVRRTPFQFGHPDCTRVEPLLVHSRRRRTPQIAQIIRADHLDDRVILDEFFRRGLGGFSFRDDTLLQRIGRMLGLVALAPRWIFGPARRWVSTRAREMGTSLFGLGIRALLHRETVSGFTVVSHHFMAASELDTATGQERLDACVFRVPIGDEMVPMCRVNAGGIRDAVYERRHAPPLLPVLQPETSRVEASPSH